MKTRIGIALLMLLVVGQAGSASDLKFLNADDIATATALGPFPDADSAAQKADRDQVLAYQASRTDADCKRANYEAIPTIETLFGPAYGPLSKKEIRDWSSFLSKVESDTNYFVTALKKYWDRDRPFVNDSAVKPCLPEDDSKSYPSGHATISRAVADVLGLIDPSRKQIFLDRADQIALDRVRGGVHYPTDIAAGKSLGDQIFAKLQESSEFKTEMENLPKP